MKGKDNTERHTSTSMRGKMAAVSAGMVSMIALLRFFVDMALMRRAPQDLPVSTALLGLLAVVGLLIGTANGVELFGGVRASAGVNLLDLGLTLILLFALLQLRDRIARWVQTATAFFGLGALGGAVMLFVRPPLQMVGGNELALLIEMVIAVWLHVALGNVLRHALDIPLFAGVMIVFSYTVLAFNFIAQIFPPVSVTQ